MNNQERKKASKDQINRFLYSYYSPWRIIQIASIRKILNNKYDFYEDIIHEFKQSDDDNGEASITQEVTNGLVFNALSELFQFIEDLFLLVKFSKDTDWFVKNIVTYKAGEITNFVESFDITEKSICTSFHFPIVSKSEWPNQNVQDAYQLGVKSLQSKIADIKSFFSENKFFYNQYKHGLSIALRPYNKFDQKTIEEKKKKPGSAYIVAFDNLSISKIIRKSERFNKILLIPCFSDNVKPHISALEKEDNLLRFVPYPKGELDIDTIYECAMKVRSSINVLINNLQENLKEGNKKFWLPSENKILEFPFNEV